MKRLIITNGKIILPTSIETDKILICINQKIRQIVASNEFMPQPDYNPQIEMFARFKMKSSFHKTKRII